MCGSAAPTRPARTTATSRASPRCSPACPTPSPGVTVNRLCASGLSAVVGACHAVIAGDGDLFVAGGVESMTRAPFVTAKPDAAFARGDRTLYDTTLGWRFVNPRYEAMYSRGTMGETGENVAERWGVTREDQDAFASRSQRRWAAGAGGGPLRRRARAGRRRSSGDEHPRPETTLEKLAALRPAFRAGGTVTAGNSSGINDGAAALVIASEERRAGARDRAARRVRRLGGGRASTRGDGHRAGSGRAQAARPHRASTVEQLDLVELNEAFASQSLAVVRELGLDEERVNVNGGAIAIGHPLGMSGARLVDDAAARAAPARRALRPRDDVHRRRPGTGGAVRAETPRDADAGGDHRRRACGPDARAAAASGGHRVGDSGEPEPRVRRGPDPGRRARAGRRRSPHRGGRGRAAGARGARAPRHRAAVRGRAASGRHGGAHGRQGDHGLRADGGRQGSDRGAARHRRGRCCSRWTTSGSRRSSRSGRGSLYEHEGDAARARVRRRRRVRRVPRRLPRRRFRPESSERSRASTRSAGSGSSPRSHRRTTSSSTPITSGASRC